MADCFSSKQSALCAALESRNWRSIYHILSTTPTGLPKHSNPTAITASLEEARGVADTIAQACDFNTSFESSVATRTALTKTNNVLTWAGKALKGFAFDDRVVGRIAAMLGLLGSSSHGRGVVGAAGAVDQLAIIWKAHPTSVEVVTALVSLCAGHIDNVSRAMRRRSIRTAIEVLSDLSYSDDVILREQTLIFVGLCAICTPDNDGEARIVVPALLALLDTDSQRHPRVVRHALMAIGNILDCWTKEGYGYTIDDPKRLVDAVTKAWEASRKSKDIAAAASWALASMLVRETGEGVAVRARASKIAALSAPWTREFKTADFLHNSVSHVIRLEDKQELEAGNRRLVRLEESADHESAYTLRRCRASSLSRSEDPLGPGARSPSGSLRQTRQTVVRKKGQRIKAATTVAAESVDVESKMTPKKRKRRRYGIGESVRKDANGSPACSTSPTRSPKRVRRATDVEWFRGQKPPRRHGKPARMKDDVDDTSDDQGARDSSPRSLRKFPGSQSSC